MRVLAFIAAFVSFCTCVANAQLAAPAPLPPPVVITDCRPIDGNATFSFIAPPGRRC